MAINGTFNAYIIACAYVLFNIKLFEEVDNTFIWRNKKAENARGPRLQGGVQLKVTLASGKI